MRATATYATDAILLLAASLVGCTGKTTTLADSQIDGAPDPNDGVTVVPGAKNATLKPVPTATTWLWQLSNLDALDPHRPAALFDVDLYDVTPDAIAKLKAAGKMVVCYFNAGAYETWREDDISKSVDPKDASIVGKPYGEGWKGEFWMNTASPAVRDLATKRMDLAVAKGCDGVEPDNIDGFEVSTGFPLNEATAIDFDKFLVAAAHARNLNIGMKNTSELAGKLVGDFDWALAEECFEANECGQFAPFVKAGKAVFVAEYKAMDAASCQQAAAQRFELAFFTKELDGTVTYCK